MPRPAWEAVSRPPAAELRGERVRTSLSIMGAAQRTFASHSRRLPAVRNESASRGFFGGVTTSRSSPIGRDCSSTSSRPGGRREQDYAFPTSRCAGHQWRGLERPQDYRTRLVDVWNVFSAQRGALLLPCWSGRLTAADHVTSQSPYGLRCEQFDTVFFNVVSGDNGNWSTSWIIDDPAIYLGGRTEWLPGREPKRDMARWAAPRKHAATECARGLSFRAAFPTQRAGRFRGYA